MSESEWWTMRPTLFLFIAVPAFAQQSQYDLILKGGHVIDAKNGIDAVRDVAIRGGRIAAVAANLPAGAAKKTIDVAGLYVTPGLVGIPGHVFWGNRHEVSADGGHS